MSVRVMTAVWALDLSDSEKIVLLALADCANDEGHCWPSMRTLAAKCSKTDRTVQAAIKSLVDAGHLTRREVLGKGCNYTVHPRTDCTPEAASPPKPVRDTPEAASDKPSMNRKNGGSNEPPSARGKHILPKDWKIPPVCDLPPKARACAEQWAKESYETHGEAFVCYWRGAGRMMKDWRDTWANRVISLHSQVMRDEKFGNAAPAAQITARPMSRDELQNAIRFNEDKGNREKADEYRRILAGMAAQPPPGPVGDLIGKAARGMSANQSRAGAGHG